MISLDMSMSPEGHAVLKVLDAAFNVKQLFSKLFKVFERVASKAAAHVIKTQLSGQTLKRRTGSLAKSLIGRAFWMNGVPAFRVGVFRGPAVRYAAYLEYGTVGKGGVFPTILPKKAKSLAMPVGDALTPAGVARWDSPRDYPGSLTFIPFRGSGIAVGALYDSNSLKKLKNKHSLQSARKLWILLRQMDIKPYHYLRDGLRSYLPLIAAEVTAFLKAMLNAEQPAL